MDVDRCSRKDLYVKEIDRECAQHQFRVQSLCAGTGIWKQKRGVVENFFYQQVMSGQLVFSPSFLSQIYTDNNTQTTHTQLLQLTFIPLPLSTRAVTSARVYVKGRSWYFIVSQTYKEN